MLIASSPGWAVVHLLAPFFSTINLEVFYMVANPNTYLFQGIWEVGRWRMLMVPLLLERQRPRTGMLGDCEIMRCLKSMGEGCVSLVTRHRGIKRNFHKQIASQACSMALQQSLPQDRGYQGLKMQLYQFNS